MICETHSLEKTLELGRRLGALLFPGAVLGLEGTLGAGKTNLVRGIAEGLGVDARLVSSPTFVLIQEYEGRLPLYHFDAYRLKTVAEFLDLGVEEYFAGQGVCVVEWADKVASVFPPEHLWVRLDVIGDSARRFTFLGHGTDHEALISRLGDMP
jgi:tRNA threonylcarbamoyladenosine biosynthesis protein TsaE